MTGTPCALVCRHFCPELAALRQEAEFADLHIGSFAPQCGRPGWNNPQELIARSDLNTACDGTLVLGSACVAGLKSITTGDREIRIVHAAQCFHPFANAEWIDELISQGAYLITPGWLEDWPRWLKGLGFRDQQAVRDYFHEFTQRLVLLDTGVLENAADTLRALADYLDLPAERIPVGLSHFRLYLGQQLQQWRLQRQRTEQRQALQGAQAELANYAMAMDLIGTLARSLDATQAIRSMQEVFSMLFGAERVSYEAAEAAGGAPGNESWTDMGEGFKVQVNTEKHHYGSIRVEGLAFPQYKERYLNLALVLTGVCGLAMENAQAYRAVLDAQASLRTANDELSQTIDELHRTQKQLVEKEKMAALGTLVAGVAHEVNTPTGVSLTLATSLNRKTQELTALLQGKTMKYSDLQHYLATQDEGLGLIEANLQRIGELVTSFKRVSMDQSMDHRRPFAVKEYIQTVISALGAGLRPGTGQLRLDCPNELELNSYPGAFAQIITNLVSNSMSHGFKNKQVGHIDIRLKTHNQALLLDYRDDGSGMQPQTLEKLFDPFFTTDRQEHTGLGMHILYNLVTQKLRGSVQCESEPGHGVHFMLHLPLTPP